MTKKKITKPKGKKIAVKKTAKHKKLVIKTPQAAEAKTPEVKKIVKPVVGKKKVKGNKPVTKKPINKKKPVKKSSKKKVKESTPKERKFNKFNYFQKRLGEYFREEGVNYKQHGSFNDVASNIYHKLNEEEKSLRSIDVNIDLMYNSLYSEAGEKAQDRTSDLKAIVKSYPEARWWEFRDSIIELTRSIYFKDNDVIMFDGGKCFNSYPNINKSNVDDVLSDVHSAFKTTFAGRAEQNDESWYVVIELQDDETLKLSKGKDLIIVYKVILTDEQFNKISEYCETPIEVETEPIITPQAAEIDKQLEIKRLDKELMEAGNKRLQLVSDLTSKGYTKDEIFKILGI